MFFNSLIQIQIQTGVLMFVSNVLSSNIRTKFIVSNTHSEMLFTEIFFPNYKNLVIGVVYRPPNGKYAVFKNNLKSVIKKVNQEKKLLCVTGDFNINALSYDVFPKTKSFFDMLFKHNIIPVINRPTRVTRKSATAIDNILTNNLVDANFSSGIIKTDISDHFSVFHSFELSNKSNMKEKRTINKRNLSNANIENFRIALGNANWDGVLLSNDTNTAFHNFHNQFIDIFNRTCSINKVEVKHKSLLNP